jgi:hypothetical protein
MVEIGSPPTNEVNLTPIAYTLKFGEITAAPSAAVSCPDKSGSAHELGKYIS